MKLYAIFAIKIFVVLIIKISKKIFNKYKSYCKKWVTCNKNYENLQIYALPLGLTNYCNDSPIHLIFGNLDVASQYDYIEIRCRTIIIWLI